MTPRLALALFRGWHGTTVLILLLGCTAAVRALPVLFDLPRVFSTTVLVAPVASLAAFVVAIASFSGAHEPSEDLIATAPLRSQLANPARVLVIVTSGVLLVGTASGGATHAAASTSCALVGEGLTVASLLGISYAWGPPTLHLFAALTFGAAGRQDLASWAWVLVTDPSREQGLASAGLLVVGMVLWFGHLRRA